VAELAVTAMHQELIAEHGGDTGLRDPGLLSASLARPQHLLVYGVNASLFDLAAAYGYGLAKNYCFVDGNKRIALTVIDVFLRLNRYKLVAPEAEAVIMMLSLEGVENQETLARWIELNSQEL
jgi:death-on-curing protein